MTERKRHFVGQVQIARGRPENVELFVDDRTPEDLVQTFTDQDATPSVKTTARYGVFKTANTVGTTITDFDDGYTGQTLHVIIGDNNTIIDFSSSGLKGNAGADWSPVSGDSMTAFYDGTDWYCDVRGRSASSVKSWPMLMPTGSSGTFYFGGYYDFHSSAFTPAGGTNVGTANSAYAAHALVVLGAASTDMVVRVTGTSITDAGVRTTSDTQDIDTSGGSTNDYYETSKKWIGQVSYTLQSGTGVTINAGFSKYWDFANANFTVKALEALWVAGASDSAPNIELLHHKTTGWTYGAGGAPTPPTAIASMDTDHSTESQFVSGEYGAWKRTNLSTLISGSTDEGILWRVTTTANLAVRLGNLEVTVI